MAHGDCTVDEARVEPLIREAVLGTSLEVGSRFAWSHPVLEGLTPKLRRLEAALAGGEIGSVLHDRATSAV
jgi:hypothetical protein